MYYQLCELLIIGYFPLTNNKKVLKEGRILLTKWTSNSPQVRETLKQLPDCDHEEIQKVLGIVWNTVTDCFLFETCRELSGLLLTKRKCLAGSVIHWDF